MLGDSKGITKCKQEINKLLNNEEIQWRQRAKALWLKEGDRNSKYFHAVASHRKARNSIQRLANDEGI